MGTIIGVVLKNWKIVLIVLLSITIWILFNYFAGERKRLYSDLQLANSKIDNLTEGIEYYRSNSNSLIAKTLVYQVELKSLTKDIDSKDSIIYNINQQVKDLNLKLKNIGDIIVIDNHLSIEDSGTIKPIDSISAQQYRYFDKELDYWDGYNTVDVYINSKTWDYKMFVDVKNELYIFNKVVERQKYKWVFLKINWNIFGFGKKVLTIHVKSLNPKIQTDFIQSINIQK